MKKLQLKKPMEIEKIINPFDKALLCILSSSVWGNKKKIKQEEIENLTGYELPKGRTTHYKNLINGSKLSKINGLVMQARLAIKTYSLPFPIRGTYIIPLESIEKLTNELDEIKTKFKEAIDDFCKEYNEIIQNEKENLGDLYNEYDYPLNIKEMFSLDYMYLEMAIPGKIKEENPEIYKKEIDKFKNSIEEARTETIIYLREAFKQVIEHIGLKLLPTEEGEKKKHITKKTLEKLTNFYEEFQTKNLFQDTELQSLIKKAQEIIDPYNVEDFKDEELKQVVCNQISNLMDEVDNSVKTFKRKIELIKKQ